MITHWKELISQVAQETNKSESYVEEQLLLYATELQDAMNNLDSYRFRFFWLGTMYPRFDKVRLALSTKKIYGEKHCIRLQKLLNILPKIYKQRPGLASRDNQFDDVRDKLKKNVHLSSKV